MAAATEFQRNAKLTEGSGGWVEVNSVVGLANGDGDFVGAGWGGEKCNANLMDEKGSGENSWWMIGGGE